MSAVSPAYSEAHGTRAMPDQTLDPEVQAALARSTELVDSNADQLMLLYSIANGDLREDPKVPIGLNGPLSEYTDMITSDEAREALGRWATFFALHLEDVRFFREQIDLGVIQDPAVVLEVVGMTEQLLRASLHALQRIRRSE